MTRPDSLWRWLAGAAPVLFLWLAIVSVATHEPGSGEARENSVAANLAAKGSMATPYLDPGGSIGVAPVHLDGVNRYTYWMPPLYPVVQAAWFKIAGIGLMRARIPSVVWGLVVLLAWWTIGRCLADRLAASVATLLLAVDYRFVLGGATAGADMMSAALGAGGIAMYLWFRDRDLKKALLLANAGIAAAVVTHPAAAVYALALNGGLLWLDRARLRWNLALWCVLPYVVAAGAWGIYIARAPQLFRLQFFGNGLGLLDP